MAVSVRSAALYAAVPVALAPGANVRVQRLAKWFLAAVVGTYWFDRAPAGGGTPDREEGSNGFAAYRASERRLNMDIAALFNRRKHHEAKSPRAFDRRYRVSSDIVIHEPTAARSTVEKNERMTFTPERDRKLEQELERARALESPDV